MLLLLPTVSWPEPSNIQSVQAFLYHFVADDVDRDYVLAKVTDDKGRYGWGEALALGQADNGDITRRILSLGRQVTGRPAGDIHGALDELWFGSGFTLDGLHASAVSAIDGALFDLKGKAEGKAVHELLGGAKRDRLKVFYTGLVRPSADVRSVSQLVDAALAAVAEGHRSLKWDPFIMGYVIGTNLTPAERSESLSGRVDPGEIGTAKVEEQFRLVREAVGPDVELILEAHGRLHPEVALEVAELIAPFDPAFFESPVHHYDSAGSRRLARRIGFPVAQGDVLYRADSFRALAAGGEVKILRPDVAHCGGIAEMMAIAALAAENGQTIAPHKTGSPVSGAMTLHVAAAIENFESLEYLPRRDGPMQRQLLAAPIYFFEGGSLALPGGPGLGIQVREEILEEVQ